MQSKTFTVPNISCGHCVHTVEMEVGDLAGSVHAGIGADVYVSRKFMLRMEYRRHTVLTSRDDNEELNQWKAGFSIFF